MARWPKTAPRVELRGEARGDKERHSWKATADARGSAAGEQEPWRFDPSSCHYAVEQPATAGKEERLPSTARDSTIRLYAQWQSAQLNHLGGRGFDPHQAC